jgi:hypothetical protein
MKNSEHFIKLIQDINLHNQNYLASFDVVSLFTNGPVEEFVQVIRNKLSTYPSFPEPSLLQVEGILELLGICLITTHSQF